MEVESFHHQLPVSRRPRSAGVNLSSSLTLEKTHAETTCKQKAKGGDSSFFYLFGSSADQLVSIHTEDNLLF